MLPQYRSREQRAAFGDYVSNPLRTFGIPAKLFGQRFK
jgi:hypothetical protein